MLHPYSLRTYGRNSMTACSVTGHVLSVNLLEMPCKIYKGIMKVEQVI